MPALGSRNDLGGAGLSISNDRVSPYLGLADDGVGLLVGLRAHLLEFFFGGVDVSLDGGNTLADRMLLGIGIAALLLDVLLDGLDRLRNLPHGVRDDLLQAGLQIRDHLVEPSLPPGLVG